MISRGLGFGLQNPMDTYDPCANNAHWLCDAPIVGGLISWLDPNCHPIDVDACTARTVGPAMSAENRAKLERDWRETEAIYADLNPVGYRDLQNYRGASQRFDDITSGNFVSAFGLDKLSWPLVAVGVGGALLLLQVAGKKKRRRR